MPVAHPANGQYNAIMTNEDMSALEELFKRYDETLEKRLVETEYNWYSLPGSSKELQEELKKEYEEWEKKFNFILHELIPKPIRGEVTIGKLRYRGITLGRTVIDGCIIDIDVYIRPSSKRNIEWHFCYSKDWTERVEEEYQAYLIREDFCRKTAEAMVFGCSNRKNEVYTMAGLVSQISKKQ